MMFITCIVSILFYILICKIFITLKKLFNKLDREDPFQRTILNKNSDFIEFDNFFITHLNAFI